MRTRFLAVLVAALSLSACAGCGGPDESATGNANRPPSAAATPPEPIKPVSPPDPGYKPCNVYFPLVPGSVVKYVITYSSGLVADATVIVDKIEDSGKTVLKETAQVVDRSGGLQIAQITERLLACDGDRVQILSEKTKSSIAGNTTSTEMKYRENSFLVPEVASLARNGYTWTYAMRPTYVRDGEPPVTLDEPTIVSMQAQGTAEVTTPTGTFKAIKLQRKVNQNLSWDYLVPGLGLVKREAGEGTRWDLKEYSGLKAQTE